MNSSHLGRGEPIHGSVSSSRPTARAEVARRSRRRAVAAVLSPLVATAGLVGIASPANAAIVPVALPHDLSVFPMRDFLSVGGFGVGAQMDVRVIRDGVQIGQAGPLKLAADPAFDGFGEVNHPGGICWNGVTPNIVAGDRIEAVDANGDGDFTVVQNVEVTTPATLVDADGDGAVDDVVVRGLASNVAGTGRLAEDQVEQRIVAPDLRAAIGKRDARALFGAGDRGVIRWDNPADTTDPHWTATYLNMTEINPATGQTSAEIAVAGQSRIMGWERTDAAGNRIGMTIWEYGEVGGPGFGGCPALDNFAVGGATPKQINIATSAQANLALSGTANNVDTVTVTVDDHNTATAPVTATATVARPASLDTTIPLPGNTTWTASIPMSALRTLDDDTLVASATFGLVQETQKLQDTDNDPTTPDVLAPFRASSPIGGATLNVLKDLTAPLAPTAFPAGGRFTTAQSVSITADNEIDEVVRYKVGATAATTADPSAASAVVPNPLPVTTTQTVKARSFDPAGNPSPVATFNYTIGANTAPGAPTAVSAVAGNGSATVSWTAPADNGGAAINGYVVETYQGTAFVKSNTFATTNPSVLVTGLTNGTAYNFKVAARNSVGTGALSTASNVVTPTGPIVPGDTTPPTVSGRTPGLNGNTTALAANITATFSEGVTGVSATTMTLRDAAGAAVPLTGVTYNATTRVASLNPTANLAADTRYTVTLTGGATAIRDLANNPLATTSWSFTTNVAPTVTARTPAPGATLIARTANATATFSENVTGVSTTTATIRPAAGGAAVNATVTYNATTRVVTVNPFGASTATTARLAGNTLYTVTLTGGATAIRDAAGNPLTTVTWNFRTAA